jgi:PLP dependent protein
MLDRDAVAANLARVREEVGPDVEVLAATKYVSDEELPVLRAAGVTLVGENRTDALIRKQAAHGEDFTWDFIGHVQSRKVRDVVGRVRLVHALDSASAAAQIEARAAAPVGCLVQVNVAGEDTKAGIDPAAADRFLEELAGLGRVRVEGLMTMPPVAGRPEDARRWFAALRELRDELSGRWRGTHELTRLSMGTSQDYAVAAQEGATVVRVGSVLYGR